eukprot:SAG31_NODE_77_length_27533_cov_47.448859_5_plen_60_part_00
MFSLGAHVSLALLGLSPQRILRRFILDLARRASPGGFNLTMIKPPAFSAARVMRRRNTT